MALIQSKAPEMNYNNVHLRFFREDNSRLERYRQFVDTYSSWELYMDFYKINPDEFNIIYHKRSLLDPYENDPNVPTNNTVVIGQDSATGWNEQGYTLGDKNTRSARFFKRINKYIPIKKKFSFSNGGEDRVPEYPIFLVYWFTCFSSDDVDNIGTTGYANTSLNTKIYFKNA